MKTVLLTLVTFGCLNAFAGGGPRHDSASCILTSKAEVVLKEGEVLDRGGNQVKYKIVMEAQRCRSKVTTLTRKVLFLHYDTPVQRSGNDGLLQGEKLDWSGTAVNISSKFSHRVHDETVTEEGIKILIGGMTDDSSLPLTSIPSGFVGGKGTIITIFGNAFPTHSIQGPFTN